MTNPPDESAATPIGLQLIGKYILIGVTFLDERGEIASREQKHGVITEVSPTTIYVSLRGAFEGEDFSIPADFDAINTADPGVYRLKSTGESVEDPDFVTSWTISPPDRSGAPDDKAELGPS